MKTDLLASTASLPAPVTRATFDPPAPPKMLPALSPVELERINAFQRQEMARPQVSIRTQHLFNAGMYVRTIVLPAGLQITGALVKIPTNVVVSGDAYVTVGDRVQRIKGCAVLPASAGRKQAFQALKDTTIVMAFATAAKTVEEAEREFTDEYELLASRRDDGANDVIVTGE